MFDIDEIMSDLDVALECENCFLKKEIKMIEMREKIVCDCGEVLHSGDLAKLEDSIEKLAIAHFEKFFTLNEKEIT